MAFKRMVVSGRGGGVRKKARRAFIGPRGPPPGFSQRMLSRQSINRRTGGFLGMESKFFDTESTSDAFATTWAPMENATTGLSAMSQGDGESQRDGRKLHITSIHIKGMVTAPATESQTAPLNDRICRFCLVLDTQTNGAQLTATNVMDGGQTLDVFSFRNLQFTHRFKVLFDKTINVPISKACVNEGAANLFANAVVQIPFTINKKFKTPIPVLMGGTTADIVNVTDNSLHMIGVSNTAVLDLSYQSRIRFKG